MNFETVSLLLNWLELGALLAILSRLARTFDLIATTQRELRRAIHHLREHRGPELGTYNPFRDGASHRFRNALGDTERTIGPDDPAPQSL
jgi:hypothetical protein